MTDIVDNQSALWAVILVVVLPLVIIGIGEVEERLRQRDSVFTRPVRLLRTWAIPIFAAWALLSGVFGVGHTNFVNRILGSALVIALVVVALAVLRIVLDQVAERSVRSGRKRAPQLLLALPRVALLIVTGWVLLDSVWGVDLSAALTALGVTSLVVSFALQDTLSGLASGFLLLADAPFAPGDWITWGETEGRVVDIKWRSSRILNRDGDLLIVPNAELAAATIVNYDEPRRVHRVVVPVQVAYSNPPTLAEEMLLDAARGTENVLEDPPPRVRVTQIDDPLMTYAVDLWIDDYSIEPMVVSDFGALVWYQSHRHDVPLPSPAYDIYMYDGPTVNAEARPDTSEVRRRLQRSPLLSQLPDDALDRLAKGGKADRFARGEVIIGSDAGNGKATRQDLHVVWGGLARLVVDDTDGTRLGEIELAEGDVFGLVNTGDTVLLQPRVIAATDCELVIIEGAVANEVISLNPALATVLNQLASTRRRRIERWTDRARRRMLTSQDAPAGDVEAATPAGPRTVGAPGDPAGDGATDTDTVTS